MENVFPGSYNMQGLQMGRIIVNFSHPVAFIEALGLQKLASMDTT